MTDRRDRRQRPLVLRKSSQLQTGGAVDIEQKRRNTLMSSKTASCTKDAAMVGRG